MRVETRLKRFGRWKGSMDDIVLIARKVSELAQPSDGSEGSFQAHVEWRIRRDERWDSPEAFAAAMSPEDVAGAEKIWLAAPRSDDDFVAVVIRPTGRPHAVFVAVEGLDAIWLTARSLS